MFWTTYLQNERATLAMGLQFGQLLTKGAVVYLEGCLGAGKTTFCRGVLSAFGRSGPVKSPTYTLVETYEFDSVKVYHFDLYRLGDPEELEFIGIRDYFSEKNVVLIEWPGRGAGYLPPPDLIVELNPEGEGRKLIVESDSQCGENVLSLLSQQDPCIKP